MNRILARFSTPLWAVCLLVFVSGCLEDAVQDAVDDAISSACIDVDGDGYGIECEAGPDCDDTNANLNVTCDETACVDADGDGYGQDCAAGADCDDADATVYQSQYAYPDTDGDTYATEVSAMICTGASLPTGYLSAAGGDCDDADSSVFESKNLYIDADGDGVGGPSMATVCAGSAIPSGYSDKTGDCNDGDGGIYQNLYGYPDVDGDGYSSAVSQTVCSGTALPAGFTAAPGADCNDNQSSINPGANDTPGDAIDSDCDGIDGAQPTDSTSIFVSVAGSDSNPGTMAQPVSTLARGVALAAASGKSVMMAQGTYTVTADIADSVVIGGGFSSDFMSRSATMYTTVLTAAAGDVTTVGIASNVTVTIALVSAYPATGSGDRYVFDSQGNLTLSNVMISGQGGSGANDGNTGVRQQGGSLWFYQSTVTDFGASSARRAWGIDASGNVTVEAGTIGNLGGSRTVGLLARSGAIAVTDSLVSSQDSNGNKQIGLLNLSTKLTVDNSELLGSNSGSECYGLFNNPGASALVRDSFVHGGICSDVYGIFSAGGSIRTIDSDILGGKSMSDLYGIRAEGRPWDNDRIAVNGGSVVGGQQNSGVDLYGIRANNVDLEVRDTTKIHAGVASLGGSSAYAIHINMGAAPRSVTIENNNEIVGIASNDPASGMYAIYQRGAGDTRIVGNGVIAASRAVSDTTTGDIQIAGIRLESQVTSDPYLPGTILIQNNTIYGAEVSYAYTGLNAGLVIGIESHIFDFAGDRIELRDNDIVACGEAMDAACTGLVASSELVAVDNVIHSGDTLGQDAIGVSLDTAGRMVPMRTRLFVNNVIAAGDTTGAVAMAIEMSSGGQNNVFVNNLIYRDDNASTGYLLRVRDFLATLYLANNTLVGGTAQNRAIGLDLQEVGRTQNQVAARILNNVISPGTTTTGGNTVQPLVTRHHGSMCGSTYISAYAYSWSSDSGGSVSFPYFSATGYNSFYFYFTSYTTYSASTSIANYYAIDDTTDRAQIIVRNNLIDAPGSNPLLSYKTNTGSTACSAYYRNLSYLNGCTWHDCDQAASNLMGDPLIDLAAMQVTPAVGSPALNAGTDSVTQDTQWPTTANTDLVGNPRRVGQIDIGAAERP